jgi:hypothetical protein
MTAAPDLLRPREPAPRSRFPSRYLQPSRARSLHGPLVDTIGEALWRCDPLADAFAEVVGRDPRAFAELEQALARGLRPHDTARDASGELLGRPELVALIEAVADVPAWVDWGAVDRGGAVFLRTGMLGGFVLGGVSLMAGYASPGGNKPLAMSGRLESQVSRRLAETARFVWAVSKPGGMRRDGEGFAITVKVRVMHAMVRRLLRRSGKYDFAAWGEPINQHDMMGTLLLFSSLLVQGTRKLGCDITDADAEDLVHLWRYVGHVIGVEPALAPASWAEARRREEILIATQGPADDDGRALARAFLDHLEMSIATGSPEQRSARARGGSPVGTAGPLAALRASVRFPRRFAHGICRGLLGDDVADQLAIDDDVGRYIVPAIAAVTRRTEKLRRALGPIGDAQALRRGLAHWETSIAIGERGKKAEFGPPERLGGRTV